MLNQNNDIFVANFNLFKKFKFQKFVSGNFSLIKYNFLKKTTLNFTIFSFHPQSANSMLLSVKNLESFNSRNAEIYNKSDFDHRKQMLENIKSILAVNEENLTSESIKIDNKKKDDDQLSTNSSATNTNFTGNLKKFFLLIKIIAH